MRVLYPRSFSVVTNEARSNDYDNISLWSAGSYAAGDLVIRPTPKDDPAIDIDTIDYIYEAAGSVNSDPLVDKLGWLNRGATDKYKLFDRYADTQSEFDEGSILTISANRVSALFLGQFSGAALLEVFAVQGDGSNKLIHSQELTKRHFLYEAAGSWTTYFFRQLLAEVGAQDELAEFPAHMAAIMIRLTGRSSGFKLGRIGVGSLIDLGITRAPVTTGIIDYSRKITDESGYTYLERRRFAKMANYDLLVPTNRLDVVQSSLKEMRARPTLWVGDDLNRFDSLRIYGFFKDFSLLLSGNDYCECSLEIEGLT
jgi:hypothetical protein